MAKFSCILIAVEDSKSVASAIMHIRSFVDEVILIYSNREELSKIKSLFKNDKKVRIFYTVPLGLAEVYKQYAESLSHNEWIIAFDTDERFSKYTLMHLDRLVVNQNLAYKIVRKERSGYTWQYRIWRKGSIIWRGFVHEHPIILGKTKKLNVDYEMVHRHPPNNITTYNLLQKYQGEPLMREILRDVFADYMINKRFVISSFMSSYKKHTLDKKLLSRKDIELGKRIRKYGIVKIIGSDTKKGVNRINKKYGNAREQGTKLLIEILKINQKIQ